MAIVRPYEPPPDYPLDDRPSFVYSNPAYRNPRLYSSPSSHSSYEMIRTRQYPEIAGLSTQDRTPSLRSFSSRLAGPEPANRGAGRGGPEPGNNNSQIPHHQKRHQPQIQWSSSSTTSFHDTPFCPSRLNPNLRHAPYRAETERSSQVSGRLSSGGSSSPSPSLLLRSAVHSPIHSSHSSQTHTRKTLRKSCPELNDEMTRDDERRRRRMKKREEREKKDLMKWRLDDVLLWMQEIGEEEGASLLIGYEIRGEDVARWDDETLAGFGIDDVSTRRKILMERDKLVKKKGGKERTSLFDIITRAAGDQVVVVSTPLTVRDLIVSRNSSSRCLTVQKVAGSNLPLEEDDCLLEINSVPGEQFTSPLMLTKLISDSGGRPIRFVVLRRARLCVHPEEAEITRDSSSGVSSSSPVHHSHEKLYS